MRFLLSRIYEQCSEQACLTIISTFTSVIENQVQVVNKDGEQIAINSIH